MIYNYDECEKCIAWSRHKKTCPYRNMSLLQYLEYKNIPYTFKNAGAELVIDTGNLLNGSAMIELKHEIRRTRNSVKESGYDFMVVI